MQRDVIEDFHRELEATSEAFIRNKFQTGGYTGWRYKHVKQFLASRESARSEQRAILMARWTMIGAIATICAAVVAILVAIWK